MTPETELPRWLAPVDLESNGPFHRIHQFEERDVWAIWAAKAAGRPLLVRGEPGLGKTQLAQAAAKLLERDLITHTVDARTETRDLLYSLDSVRRLAAAQLCAVRTAPADGDQAAGDARADADARLSLENFLIPGPVWWALNPGSAAVAATKSAAPLRLQPVPQQQSYRGRVLLIDEIDKAEADVPNSLLEVLGSGSFTVQGITGEIRSDGQPPLIVITTNGERALPPAFLRRCVVLDLKVPGAFDANGRNPQLRDWLITRGGLHWGGKDWQTAVSAADQQVIEQAAEAILSERRQAELHHWTPKPGQAELLDLLRAIRELYPAPTDDAKRKSCVGRVVRFFSRKSDNGDAAGDGETSA